MRYLTLITLYIIVACKSNPESITDKQKKPFIEFFGNYIVCDTCTTTILVHHDECTSCGEIIVDSGIVYLTTRIIKSADSLVYDAPDIDSLIVPPNIVSLRDLYFSDTTAFNKLWDYKKHFNTLHRVFRLSGKIVEIKRRILDNGVIAGYPSLFFRVDKATEIDRLPKEIGKE